MRLMTQVYLCTDDWAWYPCWGWAQEWGHVEVGILFPWTSPHTVPPSPHPHGCISDTPTGAAR